MNKIILLDVDHTLIKPKNGNTFPDPNHFVDDIVVINQHLLDDDSAFYVALSNQRGIDMGHCSMNEVVQRMLNVLNKIPKLQKIYFCPWFNGSELVEVSRDSLIRFEHEPGEDFNKPSLASAKLIEQLNDGKIVRMCGDRDDDCEQARILNAEFVRV